MSPVEDEACQNGHRYMTENILKGGDPQYWEEIPCCVCLCEEKISLYPAAVDPCEDIRTMFWGLHSKQKRKKFHASINKCIRCGHLYSVQGTIVWVKKS